MTALHEKISIQVSEQLPEFIRSDHPNFITFLEAYYEWLENEGNAVYQIKNLLNFQDIDVTTAAFLKYFQKEFLVQIPEKVLVDKRLLTKHIREFYRVRGTEKSYKLLFRILFNQNVDFYYPSTDILRVSDGKWQEKRSIRVRSLTGDPTELIGRSIRGSVSDAHGLVEEVLKLQIGVYTVYEIFINRGSLIGTFAANETIEDENELGITARVFPVVSSITVTDPGEGYSVGDKLTITGGTGGTGAVAKVEEIGSNGEVLSVKMINYGANYKTVPTVTFPTTASTATGTAVVGGQINYPGKYINQDGKLSTTKVLQDSYLYQQFSYVLKSEESINFYRDAVKKLLHPSGLIFFGFVEVVDHFDLDVGVPDVGGMHTNLVIESSVDVGVQSNTHGEDLERFSTILVLQVQQSESSYKIGPSLRSFERDKLKYLPSYRQPNAGDIFAGTNNEGYWDDWGNYQVKDFDKFTLDDITLRPYLKTNVMPEPYLVSALQIDDLTSVIVRPAALVLQVTPQEPTGTVIDVFPGTISLASTLPAATTKTSAVLTVASISISALPVNPSLTTNSSVTISAPVLNM